MKNELGPLLGEGTQENLSFWRRCPLSPCKQKNHGEEGRIKKGRREDSVLGDLSGSGSQLRERVWEEGRLRCPESGISA